MKIFFSGDAHGAMKIWKKWVKIPDLYCVDVLMLCGDLTGKVLVPIIEQMDGTYKVYYLGEKLVLANNQEVKTIEDKLADVGEYSILCKQSVVDMLKTNPEAIEEVIKKKINERMQEWLELLIKQVDTSKTTVIVMPGNDDFYSIDPIIQSYYKQGIVWCLDNVIKIGGIEIISIAHSNPTPWNTPREATEAELSKMIENLVSKLHDPHNAIFNFHVPPYGTNIDRAPELGKDRKPVIISGRVNYIHAGSKMVRKAIEKYQPILALHGHIHESPGFEKIGNTVCINPGSEYSEGILRGYIIEIMNGTLKNYWKVEG